MFPNNIGLTMPLLRSLLSYLLCLGQAWKLKMEVNSAVPFCGQSYQELQELPKTRIQKLWPPTKRYEKCLDRFETLINLCVGCWYESVPCNFRAASVIFSKRFAHKRQYHLNVILFAFFGLAKKLFMSHQRKTFGFERSVQKLHL